MKYLGANAYNQITDPVTGAITWELNPTSRAIEYTDQDLQTWLDKKAVPKELGEFGLSEIKRMREEYESSKKFLEENPNPTQEQVLEWYKTRKMHTREELEKGTAFLNFLLDNHEKLKLVLEASDKPEMFAIPANSLMFSLLAMFAGKPERIPSQLLEKPHNERTQKEKEQAEKYLNEIFKMEKEYDYSDGKETIKEKRVALICDNWKIEAKAEISTNLFRYDPLFREERLAMYIKRTYGSEGIRHLLGLIVGLEENFRKGHFEWSVNEHLERLGYRKKTALLILKKNASPAQL